MRNSEILLAAVVAAGIVAGGASSALAQRASCGQVFAQVESERELERAARDELRLAVQTFAGQRGEEAETEAVLLRPMSSRFSRHMRQIQNRVTRHSGNVARLNRQYARMGCDEVQQAQRPAIDPGVAAAAILGFGLGAALQGGGYGRSYGSHGHGGYSRGHRSRY